MGDISNVLVVTCTYLYLHNKTSILITNTIYYMNFRNTYFLKLLSYAPP